ncbi:uncharacterized protein EMH_0096490 [Eimeria mitis]|uniref:Uncharacterized protein n=1 Tax=Eimeria mitis TaxID=44415 RepID=U6KGB4_9EIME|nr:uncharacterized protein EMH_0096490 [Eimeria mitis]CDJ35297.1 hypothetical protein EMH_0096490 [Eimeria mitis]
MVCLCLQTAPGATALRGDGHAAAPAASATADAAVVFRQGLVGTLRACWDRSRTFRGACIRLLRGSEGWEETEDTSCPVLHPAVRLALLLQWPDALQQLPPSFYPSVTSALQHCQEALEEGASAAGADSSNNSSSSSSKRKKRKNDTSSPSPIGVGWAEDVMEALKLSVYARDSTEGASGKRVRAKGAPWQVAASFLRARAEKEGPATCLLVADAPVLWAEAVQQFLTSLCMQQPGGEVLARFSVVLARDLEEMAGTFAVGVCLSF